MNSTQYPTLPIPASFKGLYFVTLRLQGALPESFGQNLALQYYTRQLEFAQHPDGSAQLRQARKRLFARYDQALDLEKYGQAYFREPTMAQIVADELHRFDGADFDLLAYAILPNHVHLLLDLHKATEEEPLVDNLESLSTQPLRDVLKRIQNATETPLKKALRQLGEHIDLNTFQKHNPNGNIKLEGKLWHEQTFDFRVHDAVEHEKVIQYILHNPVKAELVEDWKEWPFSYYKT